MIPILIIFAFLYGVSMKIADLLNEHGLKWFKFSDIIFGLLWGTFGAIIIYYSDPITGSLVLAMNLAFLVRGRLDFINHQLATFIVIFTAIFVGQIEFSTLVLFTMIFWFFGWLKDQMDVKLKRFANHWLGRANESMLYYPIPTLILGIISSHFTPFIIFTMYTVAYNATKLIAAKYGYR